MRTSSTQRRCPASGGRSTQPLDLWGRAASEEATVALATWAYRGRGYRIPQGARLAVASAVRARARPA
jgi:hypothetical protein